MTYEAEKFVKAANDQYHLEEYQKPRTFNLKQIRDLVYLHLNQSQLAAQIGINRSHIDTLHDKDAEFETAHNKFQSSLEAMDNDFNVKVTNLDLNLTNLTQQLSDNTESLIAKLGIQQGQINKVGE